VKQTKSVQQEAKSEQTDAMLTGGKSTSMLLYVALFSSFFLFAALVK